MQRNCLRIFSICAFLSVAGTCSVSSGGLILGQAADFVVLGIDDGTVIINSATSIEGDVGYSRGVISNTNQKVDSFVGTVFVHSTATFDHTAATFAPSGGILGFPVGNAVVDAKLDQANADAIAASAFYASKATTHTLGVLGDDDSQVINSVGALNIISLTSLNFKEDSLTLNSRLGFEDTFVFNVDGDFDWSNSKVILNGTSAGNVLFNFTNDSDILIKKSGTEFSGIILAPTGEVEYHNPATFTGAILAKHIDLHSDFNLHKPAATSPVPEPTGLALLASGIFGLIGYRLRRKQTLVA